MAIPQFFKEIIWAFYPPRYKQLSEQPFLQSVKYFSRILLIAFLLTGLLYIPKLFMLRGTIQSELEKFETFKISANVSQIAPLAIPRHNPWVVVDLNDDVKLTKELFVIGNQSLQYRFLGIKTLPREQLKDVSTYRASSSGFFTSILLLMLPGIALLLYIRTWLKYFFLILFMGTVFFLLLDLSRYKLKWKQMLNIAAHAITPIIFLEVIASFATTIFLLPFLRFLGVSIYGVSMLIYAALMVLAIVGCRIEDGKKK